MTAAIDKVLAALDGVRSSGDRWEAKCPAHDDRRASLCIDEGRDGRVLLKCQAGCTYKAVVAAAGLQITDLFARVSDQTTRRTLGRLIETYTYCDVDGTRVFEVERREPKEFLQKLPGAARYGLSGTKRIPYRLFELTMSDPGRGVFVPEGEKDVNRLMELGLVATCNPGGAEKWRDEYSEFLTGRTVYILRDNDDAGRRHAEQVARSLHGKAREVRIIMLPDLPPKGDVSDWLDAGHTIEELRAVVHATRRWTLSTTATVAGVTHAGRATLYDLGAYNSSVEATTIDWLINEWLIRGQIHLTVGEEKRGKSTQMWRRIAAVSHGDSFLDHYTTRAGHVVVVTEMDPSGIRQLLDDDGIEPDWTQIRTLFIDEYPPAERLAAIRDACTEWQPALLALDPIDECLGLDAKGVFNPSTTSEGFDVLRTLARAGVAIDGLYHYNNQGKIANSYKFRSKPDHLYTIRGADPGDVTIEYVGRLRAIPRKRRMQGNGQDGYMVTELITNATGRPAKSQQLVLDCLRKAVPAALSLAEITRVTGLGYKAVQHACDRLVERGLAVKVSGASAYRTAAEELDLH